MTSEQQLDKAIQGLAAEIKPENDLWPELEQKLPARQPRWYANRAGWAAAAGFALIAAFGWRLTLLPDITEPQLAISEESAAVLIAQEYEAVKAEKLGSINQVSEYFGDWRHQLRVWDAAITQVSQALDFYPDEPVLLGQMQGLYQQQLDYLQMISAVDTEYYFMGNEL